MLEKKSMNLCVNLFIFKNQRNHHHNYSNLSKKLCKLRIKTKHISCWQVVENGNTSVQEKYFSGSKLSSSPASYSYVYLEEKKWEHEEGKVSRELELYLTFLTVYISCYKFEVNRAKGCLKLSDFCSKWVKTTHFLTTALLFIKSPTHTCANCHKRDLFLFEWVLTVTLKMRKVRRQESEKTQ